MVRIINSVLSLTLLSLTFTLVLAHPVNDVDNATTSTRSINLWMSQSPNGAVPCISMDNPTKCMLRATQYKNNDISAVFEVFDSRCVKIGADSIALGNHITIDSELPWTIEMNVSNDWDIMPIGMYADHSGGQGPASDNVCWNNNDDVPVIKSCLLPFTCK